MTFIQATATMSDFEWTIIKGLGTIAVAGLYGMIGILSKVLFSLNKTLQDLRVSLPTNYVSKAECTAHRSEIITLLTKE